MEPVVFFPSRLRMVLSLVVMGLFFLPAICLAFQIPLLNGAFAFYGFVEGAVLIERAIGFAALAWLSYLVGQELAALIWRMPTLVADEDGITVKGKHIAWPDYRGVEIGGVRVNGMPVRHLEIMGRRKYTLPNASIPGKVEQAAERIIAFATATLANRYAHEAIDRPAEEAEHKAIRPRRPTVSSRTGIRHGVV